MTFFLKNESTFSHFHYDLICILQKSLQRSAKYRDHSTIYHAMSQLVIQNDAYEFLSFCTI